MRDLQTWMLSAISAPLPPPPPDVAAHILPSATLQPEERIALYRDMYEVRMVEALEADYPALRALIGHSKFHRLARGGGPGRAAQARSMAGRPPPRLLRLPHAAQRAWVRHALRTARRQDHR